MLSVFKCRSLPAPARSPVEPQPSILDPKKVFEVHHEALKDTYKELIDANQKIAGILLIVLGWFAAKDNPLSMLCYSRYLVYFALIFTIVGFAAIYHLFQIVFTRNTAAIESLQRNGHSDDLYGRFVVTKSMLWCGLFGQYAMLVGILTVIFYKYDFLWSKTCPP
jgi:hypothetical protein